MVEIRLINFEDLPGCAGLRDAWEVILLAKIQSIIVTSNCFWIFF